MKRNFTPPPGAERRLIYRISGAGRPDPGLPLAVRSTGHYRVPASWIERSDPKWFLELFWTARGGGTYRLGRHTYQARPGDIFIYDAGESHDLTAGPHGWEYRWVTLDSAGAAHVRTLFGLPRHHPAGPCPAALFEHLADLLASPTTLSHREASVTAYAILEAAGRRASGRDPHEAGLATRVRAVLDRDFTRADLGIETIAAALNVHRTTVRRAFLAAHGLCPSTYLARRRLQHALALLRTTDLPVADVATAAGFTTPEYLARIVHAHTGTSPRAFRHQEHAHLHKK